MGVRFGSHADIEGIKVPTEIVDFAEISNVIVLVTGCNGLSIHIHLRVADEGAGRLADVDITILVVVHAVPPSGPAIRGDLYGDGFKFLTRGHQLDFGHRGFPVGIVVGTAATVESNDVGVALEFAEVELGAVDAQRREVVADDDAGRRGGSPNGIDLEDHAIELGLGKSCRFGFWWWILVVLVAPPKGG